MKYLVIILVISIFSLCLAACQSEPATPEPVTFVPPPVTLSSSGDPATGENENTEPPAGGSNVSAEIIDETQQTIGATATLPPPPQPTLTPTPDNNNEASGSGSDGGGASGGNEVDTNSTQSFTDVTINSGAYEGAILETQLNFGGGEAEYLCIGKDGLIENIYGDMSIEELIANGCDLIDGQPVVVANSGNGPANKRANNKFWADDLIRQVFWNFNPFEDIKVLFYEHEFDSSTIGSLIG